jgi:hypothetical protein
VVNGAEAPPTRRTQKAKKKEGKSFFLFLSSFFLP